jgi:hypothetical protein
MIKQAICQLGERKYPDSNHEELKEFIVEHLCWSENEGLRRGSSALRYSRYFGIKVWSGGCRVSSCVIREWWV